MRCGSLGGHLFALFGPVMVALPTPIPRFDVLALDDTAAALLFRDAHTGHAFGPDPVSDEQVEAIWDLIRWAPTSANTNPMRLLLVRSPQARARLVGHLSESNRAKTLAAPLTVVAAADLRFHELWPRLAPHRAEMAARIEDDPAARERLATFSATLQIAYFIIGIRAAGLAVGPMAGFDGEALDQEFFSDGSWRTLLVINIGSPSEEGYRERLPRPDFADIARVV